MNREIHVRIWESPEVKVLRATRHKRKSIANAKGVLCGTGRFEDAKGDGTLTGVRVTPLATGAELYNHFVINMKK
jgi:hypothetical protein